MKEYLAVRGIEFQSVNILQDQENLEELQKLGARSVPVVSCGERYVYAQVIKDVVEFLQLDDDTAPQLSPIELATRYYSFLDTAIRLTRQMPDDCLHRQLPDRPRSWRVLMHHVFQIPASFLDMEQTGETLTYENMVAEPPDDLQTSSDIAHFGEAVRERFDAWWQIAKTADYQALVPTYFGDITRHEMLERTVWHSTQHIRQMASLLQQANVTPDRPLSMDDIQGLPLTHKIWDET